MAGEPPLSGECFKRYLEDVGRQDVELILALKNEALPHPLTAPAIMGDDKGEFRIEVLLLRQCFLEAFRLRSEHASAITDPLRAEMAA